MERAKADPGVWVLAALAVGTAAGALVLAGLDSPWALLCTVVFLVAVVLLAIYVGMTSRP